MLLTPAPLYLYQYGALHDGTPYMAVEDQRGSRRLVWRRIPFWDLLNRADYIARRHLGQRIVTLRVIKGRRRPLHLRVTPLRIRQRNTARRRTELLPGHLEETMTWAVKLDGTLPLHGPFDSFTEAEHYAAGHQAVTIYRILSPTAIMETSPTTSEAHPMIKSIENVITQHRPIKPDATVLCQECPGTPWTIQHFYDVIKAACNDAD